MSRRVRPGLWAYLVGIVSAVVCGALVIYGVYDGYQRSAEAEKGALSDARELAESIGATSAHFLITGSYDGLEQMLTRLARLGQTRAVSVFDADGRLVSAVVNDNGRIRPSFERRTFRPPAADLQSIDGDVVTVVLPIDRGTRIGWVMTVSGIRDLRSVRSRIWTETATTTLVTVAAVAIVLAWALRRTVRPIEEASRFAASLQQTRGQQLPPAESVREVDDLTRTLNRLSTSLREQDEALQASEMRKGAILEASLDCLITIDAEGRIVDFNPAAERTFGYARDEAMGKPMAEMIVPPAARQAHHAGMARYLETGHGPVLRKRIELSAIRRDGSEFPVEIVIVPFEIAGAKYFCGYLRDISEQKALEAERAQAEAALRAQTDRLQIGQAVAGLLLMTWDIRRDVLTCSASEEWLRGPVPQDTGRYPPFAEQVHPDDRAAFLAMRARALEGAAETAEYRVVRTDGAVRWVSSRHLLQRDDRGNPQSMLVALHDITERKLAEEAIRDAQLKLQRLLASTRVIVYVDVPTHDFPCTYISENVGAVLGFEAAEFLAGPELWLSRVHPDDLQHIHRDLDRLLETGSFEHEYRFRHRDGSYRWMRDEQTLLRDASGAPVEIVGAWWDVTEQKLAEQALAQARDRALAAEATLTAAIENVSQGILMLDAEDRVMLLNSRGRELLGIPPEFARPGIPLRKGLEFQLQHGEFDAEPAKREELLREAMSRETNLAGYERTRPNGAVLEIRSNRLPDGRFVRTYTDVTERKRVATLLQASLRELEGQKFALDEHAIVSVTDLDGNIVYANDKFVQVSGYRREELLGKTHRLVKSGRHGSGFYRDMWTTIAAGRVWHGEIVNRSKDGTLYWLASTIVPLLDDSGNPRQYIAIRTDITERKLAELALAESRQRELLTGHAIQQSLLLGDPPRIAQLEIAAYAQPSQGVDGDFYDFFSVHGRCCDVLIGDVMGKGVTAALMGAGVKSQYGRVLAELLAPSQTSGELPQPRSIVNHLHARLTADLIRLDAFVTLAYCRVDLQLRRLAYISAGHTPAILLAAGGELSLLEGDNLPVGVRADERYTETEHPFDEGDLLFLYSDGVTEARNAAGEEFGVPRLARRVSELRAAGVPPAMLVQCVRHAVAQFTAATDWSDDFTIVALEHRGADHPRHAREFRRDLSELGPLRAWVRNLSAAHLPEEAVQRLELAAVELASNIVRHADVPVRAAAFLCHHEAGPAAVQLDFFYLGTPYDRANVAPPDFSGASEGGFGLYIVEHSVDQFLQTVLAGQVNRLTLRVRRNAAPQGEV